MDIIFNPAKYHKTFIVYELSEVPSGRRLFVWWSKAVELTSITKIMSNPAFKPDADYRLRVLSWHEDQHAAQAALSAVILRDKMPELNKTIRYNRYGALRCNETGQIFRNQSDAARQLGISQSRLCQHLQRAPGYKSLKGCTFSYFAPLEPAPQAVTYP